MCHSSWFRLQGSWFKYLSTASLMHTYVLCTDDSVDAILAEFKDDILDNVNAKECAPDLRRQHVIAASTETDIKLAKDAREARGILYDHLCSHCTLEQIVTFSKVLMKANGGYGRTREVGQQLYARIPVSGAVATDQDMSPGESQLRPPITFQSWRKCR